LLAALTFLAAVPTATASSKWYVDGVHGSDESHLVHAVCGQRARCRSLAEIRFLLYGPQMTNWVEGTVRD